jgi:serine/threonine protein kinase
VVLYEMATGKRLFAGEEAAEILAAIVLQEPDLKEAPARLRPTIERCLRKDPRKRWYSMEDVRFALEEPVESGAESPAQAKSLPHKILWVVAAVLLVLLASVSFVHFREKPPAPPVLRYTIATPENTTTLNSFAISPDGRYVVIATAVSGKRQLWLRPLDALQAQPMPFTEDATYPFFGRPTAATSDSSRKASSRRSRPAAARPNRCATPRTDGADPGTATT